MFQDMVTRPDVCLLNRDALYAEGPALSVPRHHTLQTRWEDRLTVGGSISTGEFISRTDIYRGQRGFHLYTLGVRFL